MKYCSFFLMGLAWNDQVELKESSERKTFWYILSKYFGKYYWRCLYSYLDLKQKQSNQNTAMLTTEGSLTSASHTLKEDDRYQPALTPRRQRHLGSVAMDTSLSGLCFLLSRPVYDRLRCFLLWGLCLHSTLLGSNKNQRLPL